MLTKSKWMLLLLLCSYPLLGGCGMDNSTNKSSSSNLPGKTAPIVNKNIVPGQIGVGFAKGVTEKQACEILDKYKLTYEKNNKINAGKRFFYETELKYIVKVPVGEEGKWLGVFQKDKEIKMAVFNFNDNIDVD